MENCTFKTLELIKVVENNDPVISLVIRVYNEMPYIKMFWDSLIKQIDFEDFEIVFVDSGSTDGTFEFLKDECKCSLYSIEKNEFNFGDTCNLGMRLTHGKYVYFFSGHVILEEADLISSSLEYLISNEGSGYFRQIPNNLVGCSLYDRVFLKYRFRNYGNRGPVPVKQKDNHFSNAASIISRKHWEINKFSRVSGSEDFLWSDELIKNGYSIYYFHNLNVQHSHNETPKQIEKRVRINVVARFPDGVNKLKIALVFFKVFVALVINSFSFKTAFKYARAHSKGYRV